MEEINCHAQAEENTHEVRKRVQPFQVVVGLSRVRPGTRGVISPARGSRETHRPIWRAGEPGEQVSDQQAGERFGRYCC